MNRREPPQIAETKLIPLLELDEIQKGRKIYKTNDQSKVHWQLNSFKVIGVDNDKEVLIVKDTQDKHQVIPFDALEGYVVMKEGWNSRSQWELKFLIDTDLTKKEKFQLHEHSSKIPLGMVDDWIYLKKQRIYISGPKQFFDWVKKKKVNLKEMFGYLNIYSSQTYAFDIHENALMIIYRDKTYSIQEWTQTNDL